MNLSAAIPIVILSAGVLWIAGACIIISIEACAIARLFKKP